MIIFLFFDGDVNLFIDVFLVFCNFFLVYCLFRKIGFGEVKVDNILVFFLFFVEVIED